MALMFLCAATGAQSLMLPVALGTAEVFRERVYVAGLAQKPDATYLRVFLITDRATVKDSIEIKAGQGEPASWLTLTADTLHGFLNIYLQKKEKNLTDIVRISSSFSVAAHIRNVETARLNNSAVAGGDPFITAGTLYNITTTTDSTGTQFYLNRYESGTHEKNFEYKISWQYPFERKHIHAARILNADSNFVYLWATVATGPKEGLWFLRADARKGTLVKATRISPKDGSAFYAPPLMLKDREEKSMILLGQVTGKTEIDLSANKLKLKPGTTCKLYHVVLDSLDFIQERNEINIPVEQQKTQTYTTAGYLLQGRSFGKDDGGLFLACEVWRNAAAENCLLYANTITIRLERSEHGLVTRQKISANLLVHDYYQTRDKLDRNGKICAAEGEPIEMLWWKRPSFPVVFSADEANTTWLLMKSLPKRNIIDFSNIQPVKNVLRTTLLEEIDVNRQPRYLRSGRGILAWQLNDSIYQLKRPVK